MRFFRNNWYWMLSILVGLGISMIILTQRNQPQVERRQHVERKTPGQTKQGKIRGSTTHSHSHYHQQRPRRHSMPQETSSHLSKLRSQYQDQIIEKRSFESSIFGYCEYDVYPDEFYEKELEILCGDMNPEEAANYLESVGYYSPALLKLLDTIHAFKYLKEVGDRRPESREYAERVITENPSTSIELEARFYIAEVLIPALKETFTEKAQAYSAILDIVPDSTRALAGLGVTLVQDNKPTEAISYLKKQNSLDSRHPADAWLGEAYEKLGNVKTAWVYYKKALANGHPQPWRMRMHIEAIEAGVPIYKPVELTLESGSRDVDEVKHTPDPHVSQKKSDHIKVFTDDPLLVEYESTSSQESRDEYDKRRRAAAEAAHQELSQKELDDFLQWTETIMNADAPMDTNNFLMKEMEAHLKGGQTQFDPDRIVRAFETMERYEAAEGIKQLQKADPDLAKQMQR